MSNAQTPSTHDWNGDSGARWAANLARLDTMLEDFGNAAIAAADARPGEYVLDVGCGSGTSTWSLAERVRAGGHVLGIDISERLVEIARATAPTGARVEFRCADAATGAVR